MLDGEKIHYSTLGNFINNYKIFSYVILALGLLSLISSLKIKNQ